MGFSVQRRVICEGIAERDVCGAQLTDRASTLSLNLKLI